MSYFEELKRRNVIRVAVAYLAATWLLTEVASTVFPLFGVPDWGTRFVVIILALGFVPTLIFSWAYELTPEGLKKEKYVVREDSITALTAKRLDSITIAVVLLALAVFAADRFWLDSKVAEPSVLIQSTTPARSVQGDAASSEYPPNSIAVLPFVNMSADADNEYFSDGISEELLNLLASLPDLRVTARTSSFSFKRKDVTIADIARELKVAHVLEGSVRKTGNQVRVTVQLIETESETHLWSETYDRTLEDIFAIQDEIAAAVVKQLKITLLDVAPTVKEIDSAAYTLYLQGRHLRKQRSSKGYEQALVLLQKALEIDPDYAAVLDELGAIYVKQVNIGDRPIDEGYTLAREVTNKALVIDPDYAAAYAHLSTISLEYENDLSAASRRIERALQLEPTNTEILRTAANLLASLGRLDEAIALIEFVVSRDPVNPAGHFSLGWLYIPTGRWDEAIASLRTAQTLNPSITLAQYFIGTTLLLKGEPQAALEAMRLEDSKWSLIGMPMVYFALGRKDESDAALATLVEQDEQNMAYNIAYVLAYRGETDRAFEWLEKAVMYKDAGLSEIPNERFFANIHDDPRWLPFLESIGKSPEQLAAIDFRVTTPE